MERTSNMQKRLGVKSDLNHNHTKDNDVVLDVTFIMLSRNFNNVFMLKNQISLAFTLQYQKGRLNSCSYIGTMGVMVEKHNWIEYPGISYNNIGQVQAFIESLIDFLSLVW